MKIEDIDLNVPLSELALPKEDRTSGIQVTNADALLPADSDSAPTSDDEGKVPYRRFKKFHDEAQEARREAEFWKSRAMETQTRPTETHQYQAPSPNQNVEPSYQGQDWDRFRALFSGADENAVKEAYRLEVQRFSALEERATQRAEEAFNNRSQAQRNETRANRDYLDNWTDEASDRVGRNLTDDEQVALLDIMDEFSPKDEDGRIEAPLTPDQALRIYQMQSSSHSQRRETRNAIAQVSSSSAGGDTSVAQQTRETAQQFNAQLGWRANFRRLTGRDPDKA